MSTLREGDHTYLVSKLLIISMVLSSNLYCPCLQISPPQWYYVGVVASASLCVYYSFVGFGMWRGKYIQLYIKRNEIWYAYGLSQSINL